MTSTTYIERGHTIVMIVCFTLFTILILSSFIVCTGTSGDAKMFESCRVPRNRPIGIHLGEHELTASFYDDSDHPVFLSKVEPGEDWSDLALRVAKTRPPTCWPSDAEHSHPDPDYGDCARDAPAFLDAMRRIVTASTAAFSGIMPKIGLVVVPFNMSSLIPMFDDLLHAEFDMDRAEAQRGDYIEYDIIDQRDAARRAFNLTNPDTLGVACAPDGHKAWETFRDNVPEYIFTDDDNYVLLVNWERKYLELAYVCVFGRMLCDELYPYENPTALLGLGTDGSLHEGAFSNDLTDVQIPLSVAYDSCVQRLSFGISEYFQRTAFPTQITRLRAVVMTGGLADTDNGASYTTGTACLQDAIHKVLPFLDKNMIKTLDDSAFVFSLGAAAESRRTWLFRDKEDCLCGHDAKYRREYGMPKDDEWPCNLDL